MGDWEELIRLMECELGQRQRLFMVGSSSVIGWAIIAVRTGGGERRIKGERNLKYILIIYLYYIV